MKVFIYSKKDSKKIKIITDVRVVFEVDDILVIDTENETFTYNKREIKTTCYQN